MRIANAAAAVLVGLTLLSVGCSRYERKPLSFRAPDSYPNHQSVDGAIIAAEEMSDADQAEAAFGFDIVGAGVLPVQVIIDNQSGQSLRLAPNQTFLVTADGQMWQLLSPDLARERIGKKTGWGEIAPGAGRGALLGTAGGAIVGTALGVVSGRNVLSSAGKGAVVGAAGGAVIGGAEGGSDRDVPRSIAADLRDKSLENRVIGPGEMGYGVLFFPAEAQKAGSLRLRVEEQPSGQVKDITLTF